MTFTNLNGTTIAPRLFDLLRWKTGWHPERRTLGPGVGVPVPAVDNDGAALRDIGRDSLTWIGHASFLLQLGGQRVLIDPVWSDSLSGLVHRNVPPGLAWHALPPIDAVLLTHNHRDHLDLPTLQRLGPEPVYMVPRGLGAWFRRAGFTRVVEMVWWQEEAIGGLTVTFVPAEHWSRRGIRDLNTSWWGGYVIACDGQRVYHAGDSAWFDGFAQVSQRCGPIDAALLPIGAYAPRWFMHPQHMGPDEAVRAFTALGARRFVAMHWGTFKLADEDLLEPPTLLHEAWQHASLPDEPLHIPAIGQTLALDR